MYSSTVRGAGASGQSESAEGNIFKTACQPADEFKIAVLTFGEIRHEWGTSTQGATYAVDTIIGVEWPLVGPWVNPLLRRRAFSEPMQREWQRHQVEEVGLLPHFLPALYA